MDTIFERVGNVFSAAINNEDDVQIVEVRRLSDDKRNILLVAEDKLLFTDWYYYIGEHWIISDECGHCDTTIFETVKDEGERTVFLFENENYYISCESWEPSGRDSSGIRIYDSDDEGKYYYDYNFEQWEIEIQDWMKHYYEDCDGNAV